jgi:hypothetical protein
MEKSNKVDVVELKVDKYNNTIYIINYTIDGVVGTDYTTNMAELLNLVDWHASHSDDYMVISVRNNDKKEVAL